jgi:hypothetical protein
MWERPPAYSAGLVYNCDIAVESDLTYGHVVLAAMQLRVIQWLP